MTDKQHTEAQCPECGEWSRVAPTGPFVAAVDIDANGDPVTGLVFGPWSWTDENGDANTGPAGCPKCGATVLVESECNFRPAEGKS